MRLGGYAAGVYDDERLVDGRAGARFVKNRNRKGGSSSGRFARRRGEQARDLHDRAAELADELLGLWQGRLDRLVLAGDRLALAAVEERLGRAPAHRGPARDRDVPPRRPAKLAARRGCARALVI